jgi:Fic family protein
VQYAKSYLRTETDQLELTYFIDYQCRIIDCEKPEWVIGGGR